MDNSLVVTRFLFFYPTGPTFNQQYNAAVGFNPFGYAQQQNAGPVANEIKMDDFIFDASQDEDQNDQFK